MTGLRDVLLKRMTPEELDQRVEGVRNEFAGLIDEEAATYIIAGDRGDLKGALVPISQLEDGMWASISGNVLSTGSSSGGKDVAWAVVGDGSARIRCVFWRREHIEMVRSKTLVEGATVRLINGRVRPGQDLEFHIDSKGVIEILGDDLVEISSISVGDVVSIKGVVSDAAPTREFNRRDGSVGRVASMTLFDGSGDVRAVFWDDDASRCSDVLVGDEVSLRGGLVKERNGLLEVHASRGTRIEVKRG